jgi:hypothetical protein
LDFVDEAGVRVFVVYAGRPFSVLPKLAHD